MMTPSPANLAYFLECSAENYFGIQNEPSGYWLGSGCQKFNLFGLAPEKAIANLAAGYSPDGERSAGPTAGLSGSGTAARLGPDVQCSQKREHPLGNRRSQNNRRGNQPMPRGVGGGGIFSSSRKTGPSQGVNRTARSTSTGQS